MKIYLDTRALNRIFDDQSQPRIYLESVAMELIFLSLEWGNLEIVSSAALQFETNNNPYGERRIFIEAVLIRATYFQDLNEEILTRAEEIEATMRIKGVDALHLACAEKIGGLYFITCDDKIVKRYQGAIVVKNPNDFVNDVF